MLTYLRRLRRSFIDSGTTPSGRMFMQVVSRYILYAIGEILLVMIGILLALQVNNWNEERKAKIEEREVLSNLRNALTSDLENHFVNHLLRADSDIEKLERILDHLENNLPYDDSLRFQFGVLTATGGKIWTPQLTAYKVWSQKA